MLGPARVSTACVSTARVGAARVGAEHVGAEHVGTGPASVMGLLCRHIMRAYSTRQYSTRQRSTRRRSKRRRRTRQHSTLRPSRPAHHAQPITLSHHAQPITLSPSVSITGRPSASAQQGSRPGTRVGPAYRRSSRRPTMPAPRLDPAPIGLAPLKPSSPQAQLSSRWLSQLLIPHSSESLASLGPSALSVSMNQLGPSARFASSTPARGSPSQLMRVPAIAMSPPRASRSFRRFSSVELGLGDGCLPHQPSFSLPLGR